MLELLNALGDGSDKLRLKINVRRAIINYMIQESKPVRVKEVMGQYLIQVKTPVNIKRAELHYLIQTPT